MLYKQYGKYNPYDTFKSPKIKHLQVIFLGLIKNETVECIAKITNYAISTVKIYLKKFKDLIDKAKQFFLSAKFTIITECDLLDNINEKCYLFKFFDSKGKILFSKVGTTMRKIEKRLKEELRSYSKKYDIKTAVICQVIDCRSFSAEGAENYCKAIFIKRYQKAFQKNDRFMKIDIPTNDFTEVIMDYLKE